jgi:hypothetical protein
MQMLGWAAASNWPMREGVAGAIPGLVYYARITTS